MKGDKSEEHEQLASTSPREILLKRLNGIELGGTTLAAHEGTHYHLLHSTVFGRLQVALNRTRCSLEGMSQARDKRLSGTIEALWFAEGECHSNSMRTHESTSFFSEATLLSRGKHNQISDLLHAASEVYELPIKEDCELLLARTRTTTQFASFKFQIAYQVARLCLNGELLSTLSKPAQSPQELSRAIRLLASPDKRYNSALESMRDNWSIFEAGITSVAKKIRSEDPQHRHPDEIMYEGMQGDPSALIALEDRYKDLLYSEFAKLGVVSTPYQTTAANTGDMLRLEEWVIDSAQAMCGLSLPTETYKNPNPRTRTQARLEYRGNGPNSITLIQTPDQIATGPGFPEELLNAIDYSWSVLHLYLGGFTRTLSLSDETMELKQDEVLCCLSLLDQHEQKLFGVHTLCLVSHISHVSAIAGSTSFDLLLFDATPSHPGKASRLDSFRKSFRLAHPLREPVLFNETLIQVRDMEQTIGTGPFEVYEAIRVDDQRASFLLVRETKTGDMMFGPALAAEAQFLRRLPQFVSSGALGHAGLQRVQRLSTYFTEALWIAGDA